MSLHMWEFLKNPVFWMIVLGINIVAWGVVSRFLKGVPILRDKRSVFLIALGGLLLSTGGLASLGFALGGAETGSLGPGAQGFVISDIQMTTAFQINSSGTALSENTNVPDLIDIRLNDGDSVETTGMVEVDTGLLTIRRQGSLAPSSCSVSVRLPPKYQDESAPDGTTFQIVETDSLGVGEVYLGDGNTGDVNDPKMESVLTFGDGVATVTLGVAIEVDEQGHDALDQYSYKDIIVDICGKPYTFRIHRSDAS